VATLEAAQDRRKVLFGAVGLLILVAIQNYVVMEWIRMSSDKRCTRSVRTTNSPARDFAARSCFARATAPIATRRSATARTWAWSSTASVRAMDLAYISSFLHDRRPTQRPHGRPWTGTQGGSLRSQAARGTSCARLPSSCRNSRPTAVRQRRGPTCRQVEFTRRHARHVGPRQLAHRGRP